MANPKLCAICGFRRATTRDHLPPRAIFPRPLPVVMITVPACATCNNGANHEDERFRVYLGATTAYFDDEATRLWKEESMRTLQRNARLMREFADNVGALEPVELADGRRGIPLRWPASAYIPVIERLARGLFYHHFREALGSRAKCKIDMLERLPEEIVRLTGDWATNGIGENIFTYRFGRLDELRSFWIFQFFRAHWATVETYPANASPVGPGD